MNRLLSVEGLSITYPNGYTAVNSLSFSLAKGETLGIVGESGSGKSSIALSLLSLLPKGCLVGGSLFFEDIPLLTCCKETLRTLCGRRIGFIFQDALAALNPTMRIGKQIAERIMAHEKVSYKEAKMRSLSLLDELGIDNPLQRYQEYPFQFSGGMRQRVMIAIALACHPDLLIADEPTTALDEERQEEFLALLKEIQKKRRLALILISHDLMIIEKMCDHLLVMKGGTAVESGLTTTLLHTPVHPYTKSLVASSHFIHKE